MFNADIELCGIPSIQNCSNTQSKVLNESLFSTGEFETVVGSSVRRCRQYMRVRVYRNLNKSQFYSILAMEGGDKGKVIGYARSVLIENVRFIVSEASRRRVLSEKRRNVHAFCEGIILDAANVAQLLSENEKIVTYNPYLGSAFYNKTNACPQLVGCHLALLQGSDVHIITESA